MLFKIIVVSDGKRINNHEKRIRSLNKKNESDFFLIMFAINDYFNKT